MPSVSSRVCIGINDARFCTDLNYLYTCVLSDVAYLNAVGLPFCKLTCEYNSSSDDGVLQYSRYHHVCGLKSNEVWLLI